jgi:hypothetical protein
MPARGLRNPKPRMPNANYPQVPQFPPMALWSTMSLTSSLDDRDGIFVWSGDDLVSVVDEKDPKLQICAPCHCKGAIYPRCSAWRSMRPMWTNDQPQHLNSGPS